MKRETALAPTDRKGTFEGSDDATAVPLHGQWLGWMLTLLCGKLFHGSARLGPPTLWSTVSINWRI